MGCKGGLWGVGAGVRKLLLGCEGGVWDVGVIGGVRGWLVG